MTGGEISNNTIEANNSLEKLSSDGLKVDYRAGGGVYVNGGTFNMSGGKITNNSTGDFDTKYEASGNYLGRGGGVAVMNGGTFNLSGNAEISNNQAGEGGGVFIGQASVRTWGSPVEYAASKFNMTGGIIDSNIAKKGEGGGIYIKGEGKIEAGQITNNKTETTTELGGGGIYIENIGKLNLTKIGRASCRERVF